MAKKKPAPGTLSLFGEEESAPRKPAGARTTPYPGPVTSEYVEKNGERLKRWASHRVYFGTSSWKYPGWQGMVYARSYPSKKVFDQECLAEYSEIFPTVCADFALYSFPDAASMKTLHDLTSDDFRIRSRWSSGRPYTALFRRSGYWWLCSYHFSYTAASASR